MSLLKKTKHLLHTYKTFPKKRLGQNFMIDEGLLRRMISHASVNKNDVVLEIGAGLGFLTRFLSQKCKQVIAVEVDPRLMRILRTELKDLENVNLVDGDILKVSIPSFNKVVSNPPFYISSPILFWILEKKFDCAILTFQKEFAERLVASAGSKDYGRLTVMIYYRADVELLDYVSKDMYYPPPDVNSYIVWLRPRLPPFTVKDKQAFFELVRTLFTQRNKKVRNAITPFLAKLGIEKEKVIEAADSLPYHDKRVRELAPEDFGALVNEILKKKDIFQ
ncbi:MAG: 16S rRNA (adenine(1518)-N(6)/adenine(1519)-N(6))-dimethyltransferase RsmA [Candidatus Bathyarchaeia archaeon]